MYFTMYIVYVGVYSNSGLNLSDVFILNYLYTVEVIFFYFYLIFTLIVDWTCLIMWSIRIMIDQFMTCLVFPITLVVWEEDTVSNKPHPLPHLH